MKRTLFRGFRAVLALLTPGEKARLIIVVAGVVCLSFVEVLGIASIMPFMTVASNPDVIHTNEYLGWAYEHFGFQSDRSYLIALGIGVVVFLLVSNTARATVRYLTVRYAAMRKYSIGRRLLRGYLAMPYLFFLHKNSYEFVKNINVEVAQVTRLSLLFGVQFVSRTVQIGFIVTLLLFVNPTVSLLIAAIIAILYGGVYLVIRKGLSRLGRERFDLNTAKSRVVSEAFWGVKDVKILGMEQSFVEEFAGSARRLARVESISEILGDVPKYALETVAFSSVVLFVLFLIGTSQNFGEVVPLISVYILAGYRMIPATQHLFKAATKLRYGGPTVDRIVDEFATVAEGDLPKKHPRDRQPFLREIELDSVQFSYPTSPQPVLKDLSVSIAHNSTVGFAGETGSGKTTTVDLILGLLRPQAGAIVVDGVPITDTNLRRWQNNFGYVPQQIYLSNDTIAANVAFGVPTRDIDMDAVRRAAHMAQISAFIEDELPEGYRTLVGERGMRLSGGQRQRIGIARALYYDAPILVFDEATSALDNQTEEAVMSAIDALGGLKTIIIIAHRLTTLRNSDMVYVLKRGTVAESGSYDQLASQSEFFEGVRS